MEGLAWRGRAHGLTSCLHIRILDPSLRTSVTLLQNDTQLISEQRYNTVHTEVCWASRWYYLALRNTCQHGSETNISGKIYNFTSVLPWKMIGSWPGPSEYAKVQTA